MMVVWHHSLDMIPALGRMIGRPGFGASGVDLFFVISGFIMVESTRGRGIAPKEFMANRIIRIVPLYWCATLMIVGLALAKISFKTAPVTLEVVAKSLLFIPYDSPLYPGHAWPLLVPGWTLNYEMFFYLLFAFSLIVPHRLMALTGYIGFFVLLGIAAPTSGVVWQIYSSPLLLEFLCGALIATGRERGMSLSLPASLILIVLGASAFAARDYLPEIPSQLIGASLIVTGSLNATLCSTKARALQLLGDASYSIYLSHIFTLVALRAAWHRLVPHESIASAVAFMAVSLGVCAATGWLCYRFVETPLSSRLRGLQRTAVWSKVSNLKCQHSTN
jgi:exopolysaccharide production protein ExoZ